MTGLQAAAFVPATRRVRTVAKAADDCHGCELYEPATQTDFGRGRSSAELLPMGEQPGNIDDIEGDRSSFRPAGSSTRPGGTVGDREEVYLTNAIKHVRWKAADTGKGRIRERPAVRGLTACLPSLETELGVVAVHPSAVLRLTVPGRATGHGPRATRHGHASDVGVDGPVLPETPDDALGDPDMPDRPRATPRTYPASNTAPKTSRDR